MLLLKKMNLHSSFIDLPQDPNFQVMSERDNLTLTHRHSQQNTSLCIM